VITSLSAVAAACLGSALVGLLVAGARWKQARPDLLVAYAALVGLPAYLIGEHVWRLPRTYLWGGLAITGACALLVAVTKHDWNPPSQAFFGALIATCALFLAVGVRFAFWSGIGIVAGIGSALLVAMEAFAFLLLVVSTHEVLNVVGRVRWHRRTEGVTVDGFEPFVSIHVATHNEPPELVLETLRALDALNYRNYEVIVLDNNTDDPALWHPLEEFCSAPKFRFVHLENWPGFKSGALNYGLKITDERAEIIAVVDSDFVVTPDFLEKTVGYFARPKVGIVQTMQGFVTDENVPYLRRLALTYRTFDEVSMPSRNEHNAIIFAGTMGLLRRSALEEAGGWAEWCVTEDAELSVRILGRGYEGVYVEKMFGRGVLPLTFGALKRQRFRWCFGGIQILRRHWRVMLLGHEKQPDGSELRLTVGQRYEFLAGALQWFQSLMTIAFSLLLLLAVVSRVLSIDLELRPLAGIFVATPLLLLISGIARAVWGLRARLQTSMSDACSVVAIWLALTWAVAIGCVQGLSGREMPFFRTPKFAYRESFRQTIISTRAETPAAVGLTAVTVALASSEPVSGQMIFLVVLSAWTALVFWCAPMVAFAASRADLHSGALRRRRYLESIRGRTYGYRRPLIYGFATAAAALLLVVVGGSGSLAPDDPGFEGLFTLPERGGSTEGRVTDEGEVAIGAAEAVNGATPQGETEAGGTSGEGTRTTTGRNDDRAGDVRDADDTLPEEAAPPATEQTPGPAAQASPGPQATPAPAAQPTSRPSPAPQSTSRPDPEGSPGSRPTPTPRGNGP